MEKTQNQNKERYDTVFDSRSSWFKTNFKNKSSNPLITLQYYYLNFWLGSQYHCSVTVSITTLVEHFLPLYPFKSFCIVMCIINIKHVMNSGVRRR